MTARRAMAAIAIALVVVAAWAAVAGEPLIATVIAIVAVAQIVAVVTTASGRSVSTIVFTDIARSTELVSEIGDRAWQQLFERHAAVVRRELLGAHAGFVKDLGDGFLAAVPTAAGAPGGSSKTRQRLACRFEPESMSASAACSAPMSAASQCTSPPE